MHKLLPHPPDPKHDRKIITYHPKEGHREGGVTGRPGRLETIKIRVVCEPCNSGWMGNLEEEVRPLLTPIIEGTPVALDFEQMAVIARWVTLKCIVAEHAALNTSVTPQHDRTAFMQQGTIPDYFRIYLANHNMPHASGYLRNSMCMGHKGPFADPPLMGSTNNVETISFVLGRVFVHLNAARVNDYSIESKHLIPAFHGNCRIWPFQHNEMVWPRRPLVDQRGLSLIANTLETIKESATVIWGDIHKNS
jgi:hypothetical protein